MGRASFSCACSALAARRSAWCSCQHNTCVAECRCNGRFSNLWRWSAHQVVVPPAGPYRKIYRRSLMSHNRATSAYGRARAGNPRRSRRHHQVSEPPAMATQLRRRGQRSGRYLRARRGSVRSKVAASGNLRLSSGRGSTCARLAGPDTFADSPLCSTAIERSHV